MDEYISGFEFDAKKMRDEIEMMINGKTDIERSEIPYLHDKWSRYAHYSVGDVVRRGEQLYKCLIAHDAQDTWKPEDAPSLWTMIMYKNGIRIIPDAIQAAQAFSEGELGYWGDELYKSLIDGNVWTPEEYPAGWEIVINDNT